MKKIAKARVDADKWQVLIERDKAKEVKHSSLICPTEEFEDSYYQLFCPVCSSEVGVWGQDEPQVFSFCPDCGQRLKFKPFDD